MGKVARSLAVGVLSCVSCKGVSVGQAGAVPSASGSATPSSVCPDADPKSCFERAQKLSHHDAEGRQAVALYRASCDRGLGDACNALAERHFAGAGGLEQSEVEGLHWFEKACGHGHVSACVTVGNLHRNGLAKLPKDEAKASGYYEKALASGAKACDEGDAPACAVLAMQREHGIDGLMIDKAKAGDLFGKTRKAASAACEKKEGLACNILGFLSDGGRGVPVDKPRALAEFQRACSLGNGDGCANVGRYHEHALAGLNKSVSQALEWYGKACDLGLAEGCHQAAALYDEKGPSQDPKRAVALYRRGCDRGSAPACNNLGWSYANGAAGLATDKQQALTLYRRACSLGNTTACSNRDGLETKLALDQDSAEFRKALQVGHDSHCGLVIEVKPPIAKVQAMIGEVWLKIEQLYPKGKQNCRWHNGVYQDP